MTTTDRDTVEEATAAAVRGRPRDPALDAAILDAGEHCIQRAADPGHRPVQTAQQLGSVTADEVLDVLVDMLADAVRCRGLQPDSPTARQLQRYLESADRQVGLLP
ncbi:hypothetical protein [Mycolicibacterium thermoresistibile]